MIWAAAERYRRLAADLDLRGRPEARRVAERLRRTAAVLERSAERLDALRWRGSPAEQIAQARISRIRRSFWASQRRPARRAEA